MGAIESPVDIRDYKFKKEVVLMASNYPIYYECPNFTQIKDQGNVGSCVAHATASILEYHYPHTKLSTNFIYGIHKKLYGSDGPGMFSREAARIAHTYGDPIYTLCPGNTEVPDVYAKAEAAFADEKAMEDAKQHRIISFAKVSSINDIKYALMNYGPVLGAMMWYTGNKVDRATGLLTKDGSVDGGHAIMVKGWTDQGWLCQNSWGSYWGKGGTFILPWDYGLLEAYSFIPGEPGDDVIVPDKCAWLCKIINAIINFFRSLFKI